MPAASPSRTPGRTARGAIAIAIAIAGATATVATFASPWWWPGELLASFRPHLVVAVVLGAGLCLLLLRPVPALALLVCAGTLVVPVRDVTTGPRPRPEPGAPSVVVAQQNAQGGAGSAADVLAHLAAHPVDVLVLLDPAPDWGEFVRRPAALAGYRMVLPEQGLADEQVLVLSRIPVQAVAVPDGEGLPAASVALAIPLGPEVVQGLVVHTRNPLTPWRWRERDEQLAAIAGWARQQDGPAFVMGDLNVAPWSPTFRRLEGQSGLVSSGQGRPSQASWPWHPAWLRAVGIPIDHLLHTPDLATVEREVQPSIGSQHGVLAVTLAPAAGP